MSKPIGPQDGAPAKLPDIKPDITGDSIESQNRHEQDATKQTEQAKKDQASTDKAAAPKVKVSDDESQEMALRLKRPTADKPGSKQSSKSAFQKAKSNKSGRPSDQMGYVPKRPQPHAPLKQNQQSQQPQADTQAPEQSGQPKQKAVPQRPQPKTYKAVLQERQFSNGPLRGSPLQKSLQQKALAQQNTTKQAVRQLQDPSRPLDKGQLMQMFRMRHKVQQKDKFRQVLKHEAAKARHAAKSKVQNIKQKPGEQHRKQEAKLNQPNKMDTAKQKIAARLQTNSKASKFEQVLQKTMAGKQPVPDLPNGVKARFNAKSNSEWSAFFKNVANQGSEQSKAQGKITKLIEAMYRGIHNKGAEGQKFLVADLAMTQDGDVAENKFSQIALKDPKLAAALEQLKPGDAIPQDILKLLGSEFEYLKLAQLVQAGVITEEQKQEALKMLKQQHNSESQRRLEHALIQKRQQDGHGSKPKKEPFVWAGETFDKKQRHDGPPKIFMYILYTIVGITTMFTLYFIWRAVF